LAARLYRWIPRRMDVFAGGSLEALFKIRSCVRLVSRLALKGYGR
jgi:hypothetical protein